MSGATQTLGEILDEHLAVAHVTRQRLLDEIADFAAELSTALEAGGKLVVFGNGGSAADAQHFVAELVGRFHRPRPAIAAVALTTNTSILTAIANDFGYDDVFARQVEAICSDRDVVVGISTSGGASSVVRALETAQRIGARTWGFTGAGGGRVGEVASRSIRVPSDVTARIQEMHILIIHAVSELVDARMAP